MERIRPKNIFPFHKTKLRIPLFEVDLGQGVYHGNYFHLFEVARDDFFRAIGFPYKDFMARKLHLAVAQLACAYYKPLGYDDIVIVKTGISSIKSRSIEIIQQILSNDHICTQAEFAMVCVGFDGKVSKLPMEFVERADKWLKGC